MTTKAMPNQAESQDVIGAGVGILRLEPCWVPRTFMIPGRRLKLHPDDLYALGGHRGGINERWFPATAPRFNGAGNAQRGGIEHGPGGDRKRVLFKSLVEEAG